MTGCALRSAPIEPLFLYGEEPAVRVAVARRLHRHSMFAAAPFIEAQLTALPANWREAAFFGPFMDEKMAALPQELGLSERPWLDSALGGALLIDELDCFSPVMQRRLLLWQEFETSPHIWLIFASRHEPDVLLGSGGLIPEFQTWLAALPPRYAMGPERIRAVLDLPENNVVSGNAARQGGYAAFAASELTGLASVLEPIIKNYVKAGLEAGGTDLYANILGEMERPLILMVLRHTGGNQVRAASLLGMNRNTLRKRMRALDIVSFPRDFTKPQMKKLG